MKFIQTFWSKPYYTDYENNRKISFGGFPSKNIFYKIWAYSFLELKKYNVNTDLYSDLEGKKILIDSIGLDYDSATILPKEFDNLTIDLWSMAKLYTYGDQNEEFFHVDGDFICISGFPYFREETDFCFEFINFYNDDAARNIIRVLSQFEIPKYLSNYIRYCDGNYKDLNCGIVGCRNPELLSLVVKDSFEFVEKNFDLIKKYNFFNGKVNNIIEQLLIAAKIKSLDSKVSLMKASGKYEINDLHTFLPGIHNTMHFYGKFYKKPEFYLPFITYFDASYTVLSRKIDDLVVRNII